MKKLFSIGLTLGVLMTAAAIIASPVSYARGGHGGCGNGHQGYHQGGDCPNYDNCPYYNNK